MERNPRTQAAERNAQTLALFVDGVWADNETGPNPTYLPGHAVARFRHLLIMELAELVSPRDFERCASRASEAVQTPVKVSA